MSQMNASSNGISPQVDGVRRARGQALAGEGNVNLVDWNRFSVKTFAPTTAFTEVEFFQDQPSEFVTNIFQPGALIPNGVLRAYGMMFKLNVTGDSEAAADATAFAVGQFKADLINAESRIRIFKGEVIQLDEVGLWSFPAAGGVHFSGVAATTATTTSFLAAFVENGMPNSANRRRFKAPIDFTANDQAKVSVKFPSTVTVPSGLTLKITCILDADRVKDVGR